MKLLLGLVVGAVLLAPLSARADEGGNVWSIDLELTTPDTTVFRGDHRSPEVIFKEGFQPRGTNGDLGEHQNGTNKDSAFVSTSKAISAAETFARYEKGSALYVIRDAKGVDVNETFGKASLYPDELEIAVPEGIRGDQIMGAWLADPDGNFTIYVANPDHEPGFRSTDPVLAKDALGRFYDARNGRRLTEVEVKEAQEREKLYKPSPAVRLYEKGGSVSTALLEYETAGKYGSVRVAAGSASADYGVHGSATKTGVQGGVDLSARVAFVELEASTKKIAGAQASVNAFVGAEVEASVTAELSIKRVAAQGKVGAFEGAKVTATITQEITVCGVSVKATATVDASWGVGAEAKAYFAFDWSTGTVKAGGHASASLDPGLGYGQEIEVSVAKILKNPKGALTCGVKEAPKVAWNVTKQGANKAVSVGKSGLKNGKKVLKRLCFRCGGKKKASPPPFVAGFNGDRGGLSAFQPPASGTVAGASIPAREEHKFFRP